MNSVGKGKKHSTKKKNNNNVPRIGLFHFE